jgi:dihydrofolate reductase
MLNGQKIIFTSIVDNQSNMVEDFGLRIWNHQKLVNRFLENQNCLIGRKTFEITKWKGPKTWVMTSNRDWHRSGLGTIHHFDDLHLHIEGPLYVLGGQSLFTQLSYHVDEIHLYVINSRKGTEPWIDIDMKDWKAGSYINQMLWSYGHLTKVKNADPHLLNKDLFEI